MTTVLRRAVMGPAVVALTVLLLTTVPLWVLGAALLSPLVPRRLRPLRLFWLVLLHLMLETVMLVELFGLWIASGFGYFIRRPFFERIHYDIAQTYLIVFFREARRVLRLKIVTEGPTPDAFPGHPLLVCSRHAGPGDSFTVMYALMHWYGREPRVVLKEMLKHAVQWGYLDANPAQYAERPRGEEQEMECGFRPIVTTQIGAS